MSLWQDTHFDFPSIAEAEAAARKSNNTRHCTACGRPCKGHPGATGRSCVIAASMSGLHENTRTPGTGPMTRSATRTEHSADSRLGDGRIGDTTTTVNSPAQTPPRCLQNPPRSPSSPWPSHEWGENEEFSYETHQVTWGARDTGATPVSTAPTIIVTEATAVVTDHANVTTVVQTIDRPITSIPITARHDYGVVWPPESRLPASQVAVQATCTPTYTTFLVPSVTYSVPNSSLGGHPLPSPIWSSQPPLHRDPPASSHSTGLTHSYASSSHGAPPLLTHPTYTANVGHPYVPYTRAPVIDAYPTVPEPHRPYLVPDWVRQVPVATAPQVDRPPYAVGPNGTTQPRLQDNQHRRMEKGLEFLSSDTVERALMGECVSLESFLCPNNNDVDELRSCIDEYGNVQVKSVRSKKVVNSIIKWLEAWVNYEMVLCKKYGYCVYREMARYRAFMISNSQKFKFAHVAMYDLKHRQRLANEGSFLFSNVDQDLYLTIFDAGALKSTGKCARCSSTEHHTSQCDRTTGGGRGTNTRARGQNRARGGGSARSEICYSFQSGQCKWGGECYRRHKCAGCGGDSPQNSCKTPSCKNASNKAVPTSS